MSDDGKGAGSALRLGTLEIAEAATRAQDKGHKSMLIKPARYLHMLCLYCDVPQFVHAYHSILLFPFLLLFFFVSYIFPFWVFYLFLPNTVEPSFSSSFFFLLLSSFFSFRLFFFFLSLSFLFGNTNPNPSRFISSR
jgi:hypothetical protein